MQTFKRQLSRLNFVAIAVLLVSCGGGGGGGGENAGSYPNAIQPTTATPVEINLSTVDASGKSIQFTRLAAPDYILITANASAAQSDINDIPNKIKSSGGEVLAYLQDFLVYQVKMPAGFTPQQYVDTAKQWPGVLSATVDGSATTTEGSPHCPDGGLPDDGDEKWWRKQLSVENAWRMEPARATDVKSYYLGIIDTFPADSIWMSESYFQGPRFKIDTGSTNDHHGYAVSAFAGRPDVGVLAKQGIYMRGIKSSPLIYSFSARC